MAPADFLAYNLCAHNIQALRSSPKRPERHSGNCDPKRTHPLAGSMPYEYAIARRRSPGNKLAILARVNFELPVPAISMQD